MEPEYITKKELEESVHSLIENATLAQYKWVYAYLKDLEEWPIVTDEKKGPVPLLSPGEGVWETGEECPF